MKPEPRLTDEELFLFERRLYEQGFSNIGGIDEAGRGPLAGPVVAACVILKENGIIPGVYDSKKITSKERNRLFLEIQQNSIAIGIGIVNHIFIDKINILNATYLAVRRAISKIRITPGFLLMDGMKVPGIDIPQLNIIKGDTKSQSIAAASIIAKVTRDRIMEKIDTKYPLYNFKSHKGYGTTEHLEAIKKFGNCPIHRKSYKGVL